MRFSAFSALFLSMLVATSLFIGVSLSTEKAPCQTSPDVYVGVYAGSTDLNDLKTLADQVKSYTNLFVVGSFGITWDIGKLTSICHHLDENGLNFMVFEHPEDTVPFAQWVTDAKQNWNSHFLGLYAYDETGGHQIDKTAFMAVKPGEAANYSDAAQKFVAGVNNWLWQLEVFSGQRLPMYASDYVLYEYDYRAGYDAVFAQFGWNFSRTLHIALCRGAATMHDKPWGAIVTWTYDVPPYLGSGQQMFEDMVYAYQNGAKYILAFDYDKNTTRGILQQEHLEALEQFWEYAKTHPRATSTPADKVAYVLPANYGFGFRSAEDTLWGLWPADSLSAQIWNKANSLALEYGERLDIVYADSLQANPQPYSKIVFWNGTTLLNNLVE